MQSCTLMDQFEEIERNSDDHWSIKLSIPWFHMSGTQNDPQFARDRSRIRWSIDAPAIEIPRSMLSRSTFSWSTCKRLQEEPRSRICLRLAPILLRRRRYRSPALWIYSKSAARTRGRSVDPDRDESNDIFEGSPPRFRNTIAISQAWAVFHACLSTAVVSYLDRSRSCVAAPAVGALENHRTDGSRIACAVFAKCRARRDRDRSRTDIKLAGSAWLTVIVHNTGAINSLLLKKDFYLLMIQSCLLLNLDDFFINIVIIKPRLFNAIFRLPILRQNWVHRLNNFISYEL